MVKGSRAPSWLLEYAVGFPDILVFAFARRFREAVAEQCWQSVLHGKGHFPGLGDRHGLCRLFNCTLDILLPSLTCGIKNWARGFLS